MAMISFRQRLAVALLVWSVPALAQALSPEVDGLLRGLASADQPMRIQAFYSIVKHYAENTGSVSTAVRGFMDTFPEEEERIRIALIRALEQEARHHREALKDDQPMTEEFTNYWADLMVAVAALRDDRAANGLIEGVDSGMIAVEAIADICPAAIDQLVVKSREPNRITRGIEYSVRDGAFQAMRACLSRQGMISANPHLVPKIREAVLAGLSDPVWYTRASAVSAAYYFRHDPDFRVALSKISLTDPYFAPLSPTIPGTTQFTVRDAANSVLNSLSDDDRYYIVRGTDGTGCRVRQGPETEAVTLMGPYATRELAASQLCRESRIVRSPYGCRTSDFDGCR